MAYMIYQQYTTAIREGYAHRADVASHAQMATAFRAWIESLEIDHGIKATLAEQIRVVEQAFAEIVADAGGRRGS